MNESINIRKILLTAKFFQFQLRIFYFFYIFSCYAEAAHKTWSLQIYCSDKLTNMFVGTVLGEHYYVTLALCRRKSVCLSVVCLWRCCALPRGLNFLSIFLQRLRGLGTRTVCVKILGKKSNGSRWMCKLNGRGRKIGVVFSTYISLYFDNCTTYGYSYNGRWTGTRMRSIEWCHFQWPWVTTNLYFKVSIILNVKRLQNVTMACQFFDH